MPGTKPGSDAVPAGQHGHQAGAPDGVPARTLTAPGSPKVTPPAGIRAGIHTYMEV